MNGSLTFKAHVNAVSRACKYHIWALRHIRHLLSQNVAHNFAGPEQSCRNLIIAILCCTALRKLLLRCCREFRIISFSSSCCRTKYASASPLLQSLHWLPIDARISCKLAVIKYKVRSTNTPVYLSRILSEHSTLSSMVLRSASRPLLSVRRMRSEHGRRAFHIAALPQSGTVCRLTFNSQAV